MQEQIGDNTQEVLWGFVESELIVRNKILRENEWKKEVDLYSE